jgi:hypothetical protein
MNLRTGFMGAYLKAMRHLYVPTGMVGTWEIPECSKEGIEWPE